MKKNSLLSDPYSVIEVVLGGRHFCAAEKNLAQKLLRRSGIRERELVICDYKGAFSVRCYVRSAAKVLEIRKRYAAAGRSRFFFKVKRLHRCDWFDKWKLDYRAGPLGSKFLIVPAWERHAFETKTRKRGGRIPVFLEPGSAFGSGYHETTRLMVRLLESLRGKIGSFLDIGCGTGILSVAAAKLGAASVAGYDNDKPSAITAGENFRRNGCRGGKFFCAQLKRSGVSGHFDAVGANLLSKTLLEHRAGIVARVRPGGCLLVSGISLRNFPDFRRRFFGADLKCLKILRGRAWVAVLFRKKD